MLTDTVPSAPGVPANASSGAAETRWPLLLFALLAGSIDALLLIGWRQIDPTNLAWIRKDPAVYQIGWEFLRRQPWSAPPTWLAHLDYPFGISAAYLDVIPIVAVPLHLLAGILPSHFQYLGLWLVLCLVLQTWFATKLLARFVSDRLIVCLGALFFLEAPILLNRLYGHFSLCGQWVILAALWCYFRPVGQRGTARYLSPFLLLAAVAGGLTPYLSAMVIPIGLAAALRVHLEAVPASAARRPLPVTDRLWRNPLLWSAAIVAAGVAALLVFGFLTPGQGPAMEAPGYGTFSLNLLSPFSPLRDGLLLHPLPLLPGQENEGYGYLGLGVIMLGIVAIAMQPALPARLGAPGFRPILLIAILLTLLALSIRISFGPRVLAVIPVPPTVFHLLAEFRSSGRFFWPVYYLLMLGAVAGAASAFQSRAVARAFVAACLLLQLADTASFAADLSRQTRVTVSDPLRAPEWKALAGGNRHLVVVPAEQCDTQGSAAARADWYWFARLAAEEDLTLNSVYAARVTSASYDYNCLQLPRQIAKGKLTSRTAYVLDGRLARLAMAHDAGLRCRKLDGFRLCTPAALAPRTPKPSN